MKQFCKISAYLLGVLWIIGFFLLNAGVFVHVLMLLSLVFAIQAVITCPDQKFFLMKKNSYES